MDILISIDEEIYRHAQNVSEDSNDEWDAMRAIANGTPLPKGHGRLIDADELKKIIDDNDIFVTVGFNVRLCDIDSTPTVIKPDKTESEPQERSEE